MSGKIATKTRGPGWISRISLTCAALVSLFVLQGWVSPALAADLNVGTAAGATTATDTSVNVLMQKLTLTATVPTVSLSSITMNDGAAAAKISAVKIYVSADSSATLPPSATLIGGFSRWSGASTTINLTGGTASQRTVTSATTKYLYIVYDMAYGEAGKTVESIVTTVGVASGSTTVGPFLGSSFALSSTPGSTAAVITDCTKCHGNPPVDSTGLSPVRQVPVGSVIGSHTKHTTNACSVCHVAPASTTSADFGHRDGKIQFQEGVVYSRATTSPFSFAQTNQDGTTLGTCSTTVCHANVYEATYKTTPKWGTTTSLGCSTCHTTLIDTFGPDTGSHKKHNETNCTKCHAAGTTATTAPTVANGHTDGDIDVTSGYPTNVTKHLTVDGFGTRTCSAASCHANPYGTGTATTPVWGTTATKCTACHGAFPIELNGPQTGSHAMHNITDCTKCHAAGTTSTSVPSTGHINNTIDVTGGYPVTAKHADASVGTCSTAVCHGSKSPVWGANTANVTCTKCHGKPTLTNYSTTTALQAAPGYATIGTNIEGLTGTFTNGVSSDPQVGAHNAHLTAVNGYTTRKVLCVDCHAIPASGQHANGTTNFSWSTLATKGGTLTPGYSAGTCSTNYCHGGSLQGGVAKSPVWNNTSYLTTYAKNTANCQQCHGAPPTAGNFLHADITIATDCTSCHNHEGSGQYHIDGNLQAAGGTCDSCHSYDTVGGVWGSGTRLDGATAEGWGAHARHIDNLKAARSVTLNASSDTYGSPAFNAVCGVCHTRLAANHTMAGSTTGRFITFSSAYQTGSVAATYKGESGTPSSTTGKEKTCSNVSCHFNATPLWQ